MKKTTAAVIGTVAGAIGGLGAIMATDAILTYRNSKCDAMPAEDERDEISADAESIHSSEPSF